MLRIQATSRVLALLGDPVAHSASPAMHNAAIAALGLDAVYVALRVSASRLPITLECCAAVGIAGNLTVPLKEVAAHIIQDATPLARAVGAVNTFWPAEGVLRADNTDVPAIEEALDSLGAESPWLVCGTGGSARAVAAAAARRGAGLIVRSRDPARAVAFAAWTTDLAGALGLPPVASEPDDGQPVRTVINATPCGLAPGDGPPLPEARWRGATTALDLAYRPGETAWVLACRAAGLDAAEGRAVLVSQGARAFERFFPGVESPRAVMAAAVDRALRP